MKILFDTNAVMLPFTDGTNLDDALTQMVGLYVPMVPRVVRDELKMLAKGGGKTARAAAGALKLSESWETLHGQQPGDDGFLEVLPNADAAFTNDKRLATECKKRGAKVIMARGNGQLRFG